MKSRNTFSASTTGTTAATTLMATAIMGAMQDSGVKRQGWQELAPPNLIPPPFRLFYPHRSQKSSFPLLASH
ncbi:MAG: hypothetical protein ACKV19_15880 [Verrucomicrobiales bacterium]